MKNVKFKKIDGTTYEVLINGSFVGKAIKIEDASSSTWIFCKASNVDIKDTRPSESSKDFGGWKNWNVSRKSVVAQYFGNIIEF